MLGGLYERFKAAVLRQELSGHYKQMDSAGSFRILDILGFLSLALGLVALATYASLSTATVEYNTSTRRPLTLRKGTYNMYVDIAEMFQNNLSYSKSINYSQLKGDTTDLNLNNCAPYDYRNEKPIYPAGMVADTYFQDIIKIQGIRILDEGIAWSGAKKLIGQTAYSPGEFAIPKSWTPSTNSGSKALNTSMPYDIPILNERFVNWINLSMFSRFRKLWGIIKVDKAGEYMLGIESIYGFSSKSLYFTERSWLGMVNYPLAGGLIGMGIFMLISAFYMKRAARFML